MDGLYGFSGAALSVGTALGFALRSRFPRRVRYNIHLAFLVLLVAVAVPFLVPDGWFLLLTIMAQVPLVALSICLAGAGKVVR